MVHLIVISVIFFGFFPLVYMQCACNDPSSAGAYFAEGAIRPISECAGTCGNGMQSVARLCLLPGNNFQLCTVHDFPCTVPDACAGSWGRWSNYKGCTTSCGGGVQQQKRMCFMRIRSHLSRFPSYECAGEIGKMEQTRMVSCNLASCPRTTEPLSSGQGYPTELGFGDY